LAARERETSRLQLLRVRGVAGAPADLASDLTSARRLLDTPDRAS
jgi:hypothetical protein